VLDATKVYLANGVVRGGAERAFWPLFFTLLVTEVGLTPLQLVLLGTVYEAGIFLGEIPTGVVADVYSRRLSVILSYFIVGSAYVMSALVGEYWLLIISQVLVGVGSTFQSGAETAWITDEIGSPEQAESVIIKRGQVQLVSAVGGIAVFSAIAVLWSLSAAVLLTGVALIVWGIVLTVLMPEDGFSRTEGEGWAEFRAMLIGGWNHATGIRALRILAVVTVVGGVAKEAIDRLDIKRLVDVGMPEDLDEALIVGVLVSARLLLGAGLLVIAQRKARGQQVVTAMAALLLGVAGGIALLAHVELLWVAGLGLVLQGGFHSATTPLVAIWTNTFASSQARSTIHSFIGQAESIGEVIGGIALGTTAQIFTVPIAMTVSLILFAGTAVYATTARAFWSER